MGANRLQQDWLGPPGSRRLSCVDRRSSRRGVGYNYDMADSFTNLPIDVAELPRLDESTFVPLHPSYLKVALIGFAIGALFVVVITAVAVSQVESPSIPLLLGGAGLLLFALAAALKVVEVRNIAYQIRQHDLSFRSGVITRQVNTVPLVRVQHARITRGAVERSFGLASLTVNSAGPDLNIPGLAVADAETIKALVVERAGELTEELT